MARPSQAPLLRGAAVAVLATAVILRGPAVLSLPGFLQALFGGHIPLTFGGVEGVILFFASLAVLLWKISVGLGLLRLELGARIPAVGATLVDLLLMGYLATRAWLSAAITGPQGIWLPIALIVALVNVGTLVVLYASLGKAPGSPQKRDPGHEGRMRTFRRIRDGWRNLGRGSGFTVVNLTPVTFLVAPFYWVVAGVYYMLVVLPLRSWDAR